MSTERKGTKAAFKSVHHALSNVMHGYPPTVTQMRDAREAIYLLKSLNEAWGESAEGYNLRRAEHIEFLEKKLKDPWKREKELDIKLNGPMECDCSCHEGKIFCRACTGKGCDEGDILGDIFPDDKRPTPIENKENVLVLGFDSIHRILPQADVRVVSRPQLTFTGKRLHVPYVIAALFDIIDICVGCNSHLVNVKRIPADTFSLTFEENGYILRGERLELRTATPGIDITLHVHNKSGVSARFQAALLGRIT